MKNRIFYIILLFVAVSFTSCSNWLDVKPKTQLDREALFSEELGFKDALTGCYIKMKSRNLYGGKFTMRTTEYLAQNWARKGDGSLEAQLMDFDYETTNVKNEIKSIYTDFYNTLVQVNDIIDYIDKKKSVFQSENTYNIIKAEAFALRGFLHFDILRMFGQIPANATVNVSLPYLDRVSIETPNYISYNEFIKKIESDLTVAEKLLKENDPVITYSIEKLNNFKGHGIELKDDFFGFRRFRLNYYAVRALQARFYLYINRPSDANTAAMEVINAKDKDGGLQFKFESQSAFDKSNYALPSENIFCLNDINMLKYARSIFGTKEVTLSQDKDKITQIFGEDLSTNNRFNGFWKDITIDHTKYFTIKKYDQLEADSDPEIKSEVTERQLIPIIRLSEIYLIAMETMDYTVAQPLYDVYRTDRNMLLKSFTDNNMKNQEIIAEYRKEFIGEGQMFFLYKRMNTETMLWKSTPVTERNYIVPLPDSEFDTNK